MKISGQLKAENVRERFVSLWLRVDGEEKPMGAAPAATKCWERPCS